MLHLSTLQVAKTVGVHKRTLLGWLYTGKIAEPVRENFGGQDVRLWTEDDVQQARTFKEANYRKGRGRKKKL